MAGFDADYYKRKYASPEYRQRMALANARAQQETVYEMPKPFPKNTGYDYSRMGNTQMYDEFGQARPKEEGVRSQRNGII